MPADIQCFPLAFGGVAFSPVTEHGRDWCADQLATGDDYFPSGDGCMTGFECPAFGIEARDFEALADAARDAGVRLEGCR